MTGGSDLGEDEIRERADRAATDWLIRLQDDPDDAAAHAGFRAWLAESGTNAKAWAETQYLTEVIRATAPTHSAYRDGSPDVRRPTIGPPIAPTTVTSNDAAWRPRRRAWREQRGGRHARWTIAVAGALAACLAVVAGPDLILRIQADHVAGTGEVRSVHLQDGSIVRLAAGSAVKLRYSHGERRVILLKGEAYFEVARDPRHPFRVTAHDVETTVLGTGFEVRLKDDGTDVAVRHGRVRVDYGKSARGVSASLAPGETISIGGGGADRRGTIRPEKIAAWTNGQLIVSDRPVAEVIDALRPWYSGVIVRVGGSFATARVTGVYDLHDPVGALVALAQAHHASVRRISPWITVITEG